MTMTGAALLLAGGRALAQSASDQGSTEAKVVRIDRGGMLCRSLRNYARAST